MFNLNCLAVGCFCKFTTLLGLLGVGLANAAMAGMPSPGVDDSNLIPNASLLGQTGAIEGAVNGTSPAAWRGFAVGGGDISLESVPLAASTLFPGSPPTTAIRLTVNTFGSAQGFDHFTHLFPINPAGFYQPGVWVRSGNGDDSPQTFQLNMPLFDQDLNFSGRDPASFTTQAGTGWSWVTSPTGATAESGEAFAHLAFRLADDSGENSLLIALPQVVGRAVTNLVPNPELLGSAGASVGNVTGPVPDRWRAFAIGDGQLALTATDLAEGGLYPGSPPTRAIRIDVSGSTAPAEGFDFAFNLAALTPGYRHWGEIWMRSGQAGPQAVGVAFPLFDADGDFLGLQPGFIGVSVSDQWQLYAGPQFSAEPGEQVMMAVRLDTVAGQGSVEIALPRIVGPSEFVFADRFESQTR